MQEGKDLLQEIADGFDRIVNTKIEFKKDPNGEIDLKVHIPPEKNKKKPLCYIVDKENK